MSCILPPSSGTSGVSAQERPDQRSSAKPSRIGVAKNLVFSQVGIAHYSRLTKYSNPATSLSFGGRGVVPNRNGLNISSIYGRFRIWWGHKWAEVDKNWWFLLKWMIWGFPLFRKPSYVASCWPLMSLDWWDGFIIQLDFWCPPLGPSETPRGSICTSTLGMKSL